MRHLFIVAYRPLSFPVKCGGICLLGTLYSLPSLGVKQSVFIKELDSDM